MEITYEITEVPTFELRRIVHEGDKKRIGFVGMFKTMKLAEDFRDELKETDKPVIFDDA